MIKITFKNGQTFTIICDNFQQVAEGIATDFTGTWKDIGDIQIIPL